MLPRGKLLALVAIVVAASMVAGSGAFSVAAERKATVKVAGDSDALLGLSSSTETDDQYARENEKGEMVIDIGENNKGAKGINPDSVTSIDNVFTVDNNGKDTIEVYITTDTENNNEKLTFYNTETGEELTKENSEKLKSGGSLEVGIEIDATDHYKNDGNIEGDYIIHADDTDSERDVSYDGNSDGGDSSSDDTGSEGSEGVI